MPARLRVLLPAAAAAAVLAVASADTFSARAWRGSGGFPEANDAGLAAKSSVALTFSGGGARAYVCTLGYLAGLQDVGLLDSARYIGGISGGSWGTSVFSFQQRTSDVDTFLGPVMQPADMSLESLEEVDEDCGRGWITEDLATIALQAYKNGTVDTLAQMWQYGVQAVYMDRAGVAGDKYFTWSEDTLNDILNRNPGLSADDFVLPAPYVGALPLLGTTLYGPAANSPYLATPHNFTLVEMTPYAVGMWASNDVEYTSESAGASTTHVGGFVEPFAAGGSTPPASGLASGEADGLVDVPVPEVPLSVGLTAGASSFFIGAFVEDFPEPASDDLGMHETLWSPDLAAPVAEDMLWSDGGCLANLNILSFMQRGVEEILAFADFGTPLQPTGSWDPYTDDFTGSEMDASIPGFFGVIPTNRSIISQGSFDLTQNQVFPTEEFAPLVRRMQDAQAAGRGIVVRSELETVANDWWGIAAGQRVNVTWVYLSRDFGWEAQLSSEMYDLVVPADGADDPSVTVQGGPFHGFPHYLTSAAHMSVERANILADLCGWVVQQNIDLFRQAMQQ
mmetsp:Transcript_14616/g.49504  ORF Transcript_14616/g.49504 Transcript_14616/m.49504 type:complete len:565 (+) Transcript_14616:92-1786(+)